MVSRKSNARMGAGVSVAGRPAKATRRKGQGKSTLNPRILKSKSTGSEVQRQKVLALLRQSSKTTIDLRAHGIMMPATRVFELKKAGYGIQTDLLPLFDEHGFKHANCARYSLVYEPDGGRP